MDRRDIAEALLRAQSPMELELERNRRRDPDDFANEDPIVQRFTERSMLNPMNIVKSLASLPERTTAATHDFDQGYFSGTDVPQETRMIVPELGTLVGGAGMTRQALRGAEATAGELGAGGGRGAVAKALRSPGPEVSPEALFEPMDLRRVPSVPQFDLPRNVPPRGVPARVTELTEDPGVRSKMLETIEAGRAMGGDRWYNADPLRQRFLEVLGPDGEASFRRYMDYVAATSPRSDVGTNIRNASFYYGRDRSGQGVPAVGDKNPQPYGHMAQRLHQMNAERVYGEGWDPLNNPKPASFVENLVGNQRPATIDTHAFRLPAVHAQDPRFLETAYQSAKDAPKRNIQKEVEAGALSMDEAAKTPAFWQTQPKANEYGAMERYYQGLGKELGMTPAQTQASAWVGGGKLTGLASDESKPFMGFMEEVVMRTAAKLGQSPREVLTKFIRGEQPLLSLLGGGVVAASALPPELLQELTQIEGQLEPDGPAAPAR